MSLKHDHEVVRRALEALVSKHPEAKKYVEMIPMASDLKHKTTEDLVDTMIRNIQISSAALPPDISVMITLQATVTALSVLAVNHAIAMGDVDVSEGRVRSDELEDTLNKIIQRASTGHHVVIKMKGEE